MTLVRYDRPGRPLAERQFSDIIDEFFNEAVSGRRSTFVPSINVSETEDQLTIDVDVPGMEKEDIDISFENGMLTISGERKSRSEDDGRTYHKVETHHGSFSRSFQIPDYVDEDSIEATYENGILQINMDKREEKLKKQISIK